MKSMSIPKLIKVANKIAKYSSKAPLHYFSQNNDVFTVFTPYFAVRFSGVETFNEICCRIGSQNMEENTGSAMIQSIDRMFNDLDSNLTDSMVLAEDSGGLIRFLNNADRVVAVNEAYYEIFHPKTLFSSKSTYGPAVLVCDDCMAAILPIRAQDKNCVHSVKKIARLYS